MNNRRIIVLNPEINYLLKNLLKKENIKIKYKSDNCLTLENNTQIIFKKINMKRPADFYKYNDSDIFLRFTTSLEKTKKETIDSTNLFLNKLKKKREVIFIDNLNQVLSYLGNDYKEIFVIPKTDINHILIVKRFTFLDLEKDKEQLSKIYGYCFKTENKAKEYFNKIIDERIKTYNSCINDYQKQIEILLKKKV